MLCPLLIFCGGFVAGVIATFGGLWAIAPTIADATEEETS